MCPPIEINTAILLLMFFETDVIMMKIVDIYNRGRQVKSGEIMLEYYIYKYYFNAGHSFDNDREKAHFHTFQLVLYIGMKDTGSQHLFNDMDQSVRKYLSRYEGSYLNDMDEFRERGTSIEDIGEVFYDDLLKYMEQRGFRLYQLEISENPLCVYIVSNRIMLHTRSDRESRQSIENILNRKKKLLSMIKGKEES